MNRKTLATIFLALVASLACSSEAKGPWERAYTLVLIKTGPKSGKLPDGENQAAFLAHFANMARLAQEHKLVMAGPFGKKLHDDTLRGLFVMNTGERGEATAWASTDPTTQAGVFTLEYHDFATAAPLRVALERSLELEKTAKAEGRTLKPGDGARPYVLLMAEHQDVAWRELSPLTGSGGVLLLARLDGSRAFALLDAKNVADAEQKFAAVLEHLGTHTLDDWFATDQLAKMNEP